MRFAGDGRPTPGARMLATGKVIVTKYMNGRLYDVTARRRLESIDRRTYRVLEHWSEGRSEPAAVFPHELGLGESGRDTLVVLGGATYSHPLPPIRAGSRLRFGVALASGRGPGVLGQAGPDGTTGSSGVRSTSSLPSRGSSRSLRLSSRRSRAGSGSRRRP